MSRQMDVVESGALGDLPYAILRHSRLGHLCGYVGVSESHPWHGEHYDTPEVDVHGGLTYAASSDLVDPYTVESIPGVWWFGFDCAHLGDIVPGRRPYDPDSIVLDFGDMAEVLLGQASESDEETYKDEAYVRGECEKLAAQLSAVLSEVQP